MLYYQKSAALDNLQALLNLGSYYEKSDLQKSLQYFKAAEAKKNAWASLHVGFLMLDHQMDKKEAEAHIHQSAL